MGLLFQNPITSWFSLGYEADLIWSEESRPTVFYGVCLGFSATDRISVALEEYNENTAEGTDCWAEVSFAYQVTPRLQLDLGTDIYLNHPGRCHNLSLGLAWQLTK